MNPREAPSLSASAVQPDDRRMAAEMNSPDASIVVGQSFLATIARLRNRDEDAAAELVGRFGPQLRRIARFQLGRTGLERCLESTDVCQSVLAAFFQRVTAGEFDLETPEQIFGLLRTMVRNCVYDKGDYFRAARRDVGRLHSERVDLIATADHAPTASGILTGAELRSRIEGLLSERERWLLEQRESGRTWPEISQECGVSSSALRKQLGRARERLASGLELGEFRS